MACIRSWALFGVHWQGGCWMVNETVAKPAAVHEWPLHSVPVLICPFAAGVYQSKGLSPITHMYVLVPKRHASLSGVTDCMLLRVYTEYSKSVCEMQMGMHWKWHYSGDFIEISWRLTYYANDYKCGVHLVTLTSFTRWYRAFCWIWKMSVSNAYYSMICRLVQGTPYKTLRLGDIFNLKVIVGSNRIAFVLIGKVQQLCTCWLIVKLENI